MSKVLALLAVVLVTVGCGGAVSSLVESANFAEDSDSKWNQIVLDGITRQNLSDDASLEQFMQFSELSRRNFRDLGLEFWERYPNDPRRYSWLLLTVQLPPAYPYDLEDWAMRQASPFLPDTYTADEAARGVWQKGYNDLRAEFWASSRVDDSDRRFLWLGEILHKIQLARQARQRGSDVDPGPILEDVLDFVSAYPQPFGMRDENSHGASFHELWDAVFRQNRSVFGWTPESASVFLDRLAQIEDSAWSRKKYIITLRSYIDENGDLPRSAYTSAFSQMVSGGSIELGVTAPLLNPRFLAVSYEGRFSNYFKESIYRRKLRDQGARLLKADMLTEQGKAIWLGRTVSDPPSYELNLIAASHWFARGEDPGLELDTGAMHEWVELFPSLHEDVVRSQGISDSVKLNFAQEVVLQNMFVAVPRAWQEDRDRSAVLALLDSVEELYTIYGSAEKSSQMAKRIVRNPRRLGLSDSDLKAFVERLAKHPVSQMSEPLAVLESYESLRTTPFEFSARDIEGNEFDISSLRGLIVLVDHWSTSCASCIAAKPRIHDIYVEYKAKGFEIVSIAYDGLSEPSRVKRVEDEMALTWTTLAADDQWESISSRYGYNGVPQYMLLNRDGTIFAATEEIAMGRNLRALLDELFIAETVSSQFTMQ